MEAVSQQRRTLFRMRIQRIHEDGRLEGFHKYVSDAITKLRDSLWWSFWGSLRIYLLRLDILLIETEYNTSAQMGLWHPKISVHFTPLVDMLQCYRETVFGGFWIIIWLFHEHGQFTVFRNRIQNAWTTTYESLLPRCIDKFWMRKYAESGLKSDLTRSLEDRIQH